MSCDFQVPVIVHLGWHPQLRLGVLYLLISPDDVVKMPEGSRGFEMKTLFTVFVCAFSLSRLFAADFVQIQTPLVHPGTEENIQMVTDTLNRAVVLTNRRYADFFSVDFDDSAGAPDFVIELVVSIDDETASNFSIHRATDDTEVHSYPFLGNYTEENVGYLASILATLWNAFTDGFISKRSDPPEFLDALPTDVLLQSVPGLVPVQTSSLVPTGGAIKSNGHILVAFGSIAVELDENLKVLGAIGRELLDRGNYTYAGGVFLTPADTLYLKPSTGRQVQKLVDGSPLFQPVNIGMDPYGPFTVLHDGTIVAFDMMAQRTMNIDGRKRLPLDLKTSSSSYIGYLGTGPDGNIWAWDTTERRFKIFTKKGILIDSIVPITGVNEYLTPMAFAIYPDGSFAMFVYGSLGPELRRYSRGGVLKWSLLELSMPVPEMLPTTMSLAFDRSTGNLYILDQGGKRVVRLLDHSWIEEQGIQKDFATQIVAMNNELLQDPYNAELYGKKAQVYADNGATELAIAHWREATALDPYNQHAQASLAELELRVLKGQAAAENLRTMTVLESFGPSTAQMQYMNTLRIYEAILNRDPNDDGIRRDMESLMREFQQKSAPPASRVKPIRIMEVKLDNLFPSLMLYYRSQPAGSVKILNSTGIEISTLKASILIKKYMDFPSESVTIETLGVNEEANLDLSVILNDEVLRLQEDLGVQALITVSYHDGDELQAVSAPKTVTLYRNTALSWDHSGKLASFIMPNEGIISAFSHRVLSELDDSYEGLPPMFVRAAKLCDAVGAYGIEYIEDPDSPFSQILGKEQVIDTVRFPRTTLHIRSGDCDDSTALLGSLLESAGIGTAIMTSPGHVFLAFDTGEPSENEWLFRSRDFEVIIDSNSVWIPIETTTLNLGFLKSWQNASNLVKSHPEHIEFIPVRTERDFYPPLPLPESTLAVVEPQRDEIQRLLSDSMSGSTELLYTNGVDEIEGRISGSSGRSALKLRNQLGVLHARFSKTDEARLTFEANIGNSPTYIASYLNLANLLIQQDQNDEAAGVLQDGLEQKPKSATLNLLLARIYHAEGRFQRALVHYDAVQESSPSLARRFSYLSTGGESSRRAGTSSLDGPLIWDEGE